jgi:hypothetical protein
MLEITERIVSVKRHTQGYSLTNGKELTRLQAIKEARKGRIAGVRVVNGPTGPYLTTISGYDKLYSLPTRIVSGTWRYTKSA